MSYQKDKPCKYGCNKTVTWRGKSGKPGSTGFYEVGTTIEHTYDRCRELKAKGDGQTQKTSYQPNHQARISTASPAPSSTFSRDEDVPKAQGVTIFSLHVTISELRKEVKELRKQIETLASITDSTAQKTELLINKVGYPEPKPVQSEAHRKLVESKEEVRTPFDPKSTIPPERQKAYEENSKKFDETMKEIEGPVQRHPTQEELANAFKVGAPTPTEVINPMRVAKEEKPSLGEMMAKQITEAPEEYKRIEEEVRNSFEWQNISEAFVCHSCSGKCHNGFMKMGTRLCPNCKDKIQANESEDIDEKDRSDVNDFNPNPRTIEEINDDL